MGPTVAFEGPSNQVVAALWSALVQRGYRLVRSFDLQSALAQHEAGCGCPYHGTLLCTCQYVVLLAYAPDRSAVEPQVLTVHTYEQTTWVTVHHNRSIGAGETHVLLSALSEAGVRPEPEQPSTAKHTGVPVPVTSN